MSDDAGVVKKSKRTKVILIVVIAVLVVAIGVLGYFAYNLYQSANNKNQTGITSSTNITDSSVIDTEAPQIIEYQKTTIPKLSTLFGKTTDEVSSALGAGFQLVKIDTVKDDGNPDIVKLATYTFAPQTVNGADPEVVAALIPTEAIYASLDSNDKVIDIYYICDLSLLDVPESSFDDLLASDWLVVNSLKTAGVTPLDFAYEVPDAEACIVYDNPKSQNRLVTKQTQIFSGRSTSQDLPTVWTMTVTYDFGAGVESADDYSLAVRTINVKLA